MTIALACDHGGYALKDEVLKYLYSHNIEVVDLGTDSAERSVDYPDYGYKCAMAIKNGEAEKGIVICGTGIGISISANKVPGIRCALCTDTYMAHKAREHNNANILALGARVVGPGPALEVIDAFLTTDFSGVDRHQNRVNKIAELEKQFMKEGGPKLHDESTEEDK